MSCLPKIRLKGGRCAPRPGPCCGCRCGSCDSGCCGRCGHCDSGCCCGSRCCSQAPCGVTSFRLASGPCGPVLPCMESCGCCHCCSCPPFYFVPNRCACCWEWGCFGPFY